MTQPTSKKLADEIAKWPCAERFEARRQEMIKLALEDHYHDFASPLAMPISQLVADLQAIGMNKLARRVIDGEFDVSGEESKAWIDGPEGQATMARLVEGNAPDGHGPVEDAYREKMTAVVQGLDEVFNGDAKGGARKTGFVLFVFPFGDGPGRFNYMSNGANRADIVTMMKEQAARFEGQTLEDGTAA